MRSKLGVEEGSLLWISSWELWDIIFVTNVPSLSLLETPFLCFLGKFPSRKEGTVRWRLVTINKYLSYQDVIKVFPKKTGMQKPRRVWKGMNHKKVVWENWAQSVEAHGKWLLDCNEDKGEGIPERFLNLNKKSSICFLWLPSTDCCTVGLCTVLCFL